MKKEVEKAKWNVETIDGKPLGIEDVIENLKHSDNRVAKLTRTPGMLHEYKNYFLSVNEIFKNDDCDNIIKSVKPYLSVHKNTIKIKNTAQLLNKLSLALKQYTKEIDIDFEKQWKKSFNFDYVEVEYIEKGTDLIYPQMAGENNDKFLTIMVFLTEDDGVFLLPNLYMEQKIERGNIVMFPYSWMFPYQFAEIKKPFYMIKTHLQLSPLKEDYVEILDK